MSIHHKFCPSCQSTDINFIFDCVDESVSHKAYPVWECRNCKLRFTQDVPEESAIGEYYQAEAYVSHTDSRKGVINKLYHLVRGITMRNKRKLLIRVAGKKGGKLLDIGAGTGMFLYVMKQAGWEVKGLEPDSQTRLRAKELHQIDLDNSSELFRLSEHFDAITMWHVLEHVHRLHEYIDKIKSLLAKDGKAVIAVPNYSSWDAKHYGKSWAAYDVPRHLYHFNPSAMQVLMKLHGLKIDEIRPMWFDSFYVSMLTEKYRRSSFGICRALCNGLISNAAAMLNKKECSSVIYIVSHS